MRNMPNLFVLGAPKCGTTFLHSVLAQFGGVYMSRVKEPGFFSNDEAYARGPHNYLETYFSDVTNEGWVGEATPWYLYSGPARERIHTHASRETRFIVCLRDPAERAVSMFNDQMRAGYEDRCPVEALSPFIEEPSRIEQRYVSCGYYRSHLSPWIDRFGRDRFLILLDDELKQPDLVLRKLGEFLSIGPPTNLEIESLRGNASGGPRSMMASKVLRWVDESGAGWKEALRTVIPEAVLRRVGEAVVRWNHSGSAEPLPVDETVRWRLREHFGSSVADLSEYLGCDLSYWPSHPGFNRGRALPR